MYKSQLGGERKEGMDDDREERGKPYDLGYIGVSYCGHVHGHVWLG